MQIKWIVLVLVIMPFAALTANAQSNCPINDLYTVDNGVAVIEMESQPNVGGWLSETSINGYTGSSYYKWGGPAYGSEPGNGLLQYRVQIDDPGKYRFQWRSYIAKGTSNTDSNDAWLRVPDVPPGNFYGQQGDGDNATFVFPKGSGLTPEPNGAGKDNWFKIYMNTRNDWSWITGTSDRDRHRIYVEFDSPGIYTIQVSGRSEGYAIDRMVLYKDGIDEDVATNTNRAETRACNTNIVSNSGFGQGTENYALLGQINGDIIRPGVLSVSRTSSTGLAAVGQIFKGTNIPSGTDIEVTVGLGSTSNKSRSVTLLALDNRNRVGPNNSLRCTFDVPPAQQLQLYTLRGEVPANWQIGAVGIILEDNESGSVLIDNISFRVPTNTSYSGLTCEDGPDLNTNFVQNPSFNNGDNNYSYLGQVDPNVSGGVLQMERANSNGLGVVLQEFNGVTLTVGSKVQATVQLGNNSGQQQQVSVVMANANNYKSRIICSFLVPANAPLQTYTVSDTTPGLWPEVAVGIVQSSAGTLLVDNINVRYLPNANINGKSCEAPASATSESVQPAGTVEIEVEAMGAVDPVPQTEDSEEPPTIQLEEMEVVEEIMPEIIIPGTE